MKIKNVDKTLGDRIHAVEKDQTYYRVIGTIALAVVIALAVSWVKDIVESPVPTRPASTEAAQKSLKIERMAVLPTLGALVLSCFYAQHPDILRHHTQREGMCGSTQPLPEHDRSPVGFGGRSRTAVSAYGASTTSQTLLLLLSPQTLSRLARGGKLERLSKGVYTGRGRRSGQESPEPGCNPQARL